MTRRRRTTARIAQHEFKTVIWAGNEFDDADALKLQSVRGHSPELNEHSEYALCTIAGVDQMEIRKAYKAQTTI